MTDADLDELSAEFVRAIRLEGSVLEDDRARAFAERALTGTDRLSSAEQLEIYREQFWLRHLGSLREDFPGLELLLGAHEFERIARSYLVDSSLDARGLAELGAHMAEHVAATQGLAEPSIAVEMARLEWTYIVVFHERDDAPLDAGKLARLTEDDWNRASIVLAGALRLERFRHPVADLRRRLRSGAGPFGSEGGGLSNGLGTEVGGLVVYRRDGRLWDKPVPEAAFRLLERLHRGEPLAFACEAVAGELPEARRTFDAELGGWFELWGRLGWIVDVVV